MDTLDTIDRAYREKITQVARAHFRPRLWIAFTIGFVTAPFALAAFFFIPFMGQLLIGADLLITLLFGILTRQWRALVIGAGGAITSSLLFYLFIRQYFDTFLIGAYGLLGFSALVVIAYLVVILGSMWEFYQAGIRAKTL